MHFAVQSKVCGGPSSANSFATATNSNLPISGGRTDADEKWPLLDCNQACVFGRPLIDGTRLTTEHIYQQIKQAIAFERNAGEFERPTAP